MRRPHGRAFIDPDDPRPTALCDKCGFMWNHERLSWQFDWAGDTLQNKRILVCPECVDEHATFLRTIRIPIDPPPTYNTRPDGLMVIDGASNWTIQTSPGLPLFGAIGGMLAVLRKN